jgi:hypothetical protein
MNKGEAFLQILRSIKPVIGQLTARNKPITKEEAQLAILSRMGEGTDMIRGSGGFTIDPRTGELVELGTQRGFMMSPIRNENAVQIPFRPDITQEEIMAAIPEEYWPRLQSGAYLGSWVDDGQIYLDPAERYLTKIASLRAGLKSAQKSGANLSRNFGDNPGPFYAVTPEELQKLIQDRALLAMTGAGLTGVIGTAGALANNAIQDYSNRTLGNQYISIPEEYGPAPEVEISNTAFIPPALVRMFVN